ncbi:Prolyl endopeptidase [Chlorella vulgaris]
MRSFAAVLGAAAGLAGCLAYRYRVFSSQNRAGPTVVRLRRLVAASAGAPQGSLTVPPTAYPAVRRDESVVEELHGQLIADPYRWLEDPDSPETQAFVAAQNKLTSSVLEQCEAREPFKELFTELFNYEKYGTPYKRGQRYYYSHNSGLQNQFVIYSQPSLDGEARVLLDPNTLSDDGTVALGGQSFSEDGSLYAYMLSSGGSDWRTIHVKRINQETGEAQDLEGEKLDHVKFSGITWTHDNKGFFYARYEEAQTADKGTETHINLGQQVMYHVLGTPQSADVTILADPQHPTWMFGTEVTHDGRYLLCTVSNGCEPVNKLWYVDLEAVPRGPGGALDFSAFDFHSGKQPLPLVKLIDDFKAQWDYCGHQMGSDGSPPTITLHTNLDAPRYRVVRGDMSAAAAGNFAASCSDLLPQHDKDLLQWASLIKGGTLLACYLRDVVTALQLHSWDSGSLIKPVAMPGIGSVGGFSGNHKSTECFFSFTSFTEPGAIYRLDLAGGAAAAEPTLYRRIATQGFSPDDFETRQVFVASKDGTRVPMFVVHRRGLQLDGTNPTLLYGYGGFNVSLEPGFSVSRLCWMLAFNGVYAVANLRGGGEYGTSWRDAGSVHNKQNVFDDFQACAQYLHDSRYSSPHTLAIQGGSNGGLLVAACANQRPDLFQAVLAQVGVMDMLRFHKFTIGHAWVSDYGSPDNAKDFECILKYSPLHNVRPPAGGTKQYPAFLITTGSHDDRVVPLHSHKLTATLQHVLAGSPDSPQRNPLLTRVEVRAGHGAGKPTSKVIEETADMFAFAAACIGAKWRHTKA